MQSTTFRAAALPLALALALAAPAAHAQAIGLNTIGAPYTQNFDTLSNVAGSTTNTALPTGWLINETGGGARDNEQYGVDTGGSNTGDTYSYGAAGASERALGSLRSASLAATFGACFTNQTGGTITAVDVAYTGEQWRLGTATRTDVLNVEYSTDASSLTNGTWSAVAALQFTTPNTATTGAKDGNAAGNRTAVAGSIASLALPNGGTLCLRWIDADATNADDGLAIDDVSLTPRGTGGGQVVASVTDRAIDEGNGGTTQASFAVGLNAPAPAGGVTVQYATRHGSAVAGSDYTATSGTLVIAEGQTSATFSVAVNGDTTPEPDETFFVDIVVTGATVSDSEGLGTIRNDDVAVTPIHDVQGPGGSSPIVGAQVTVEGIVTGRKSNGFFIQTPDAEADADPATSQGLFVFTGTGSTFLSAAVAGNRVRVAGTVTEFVPSQDPGQFPLSQLASVSAVTSLSVGNAMPTAVPLTATFPSPTGPVDQLERVEGMRVAVADATVVGPTQGNTNEPNATGTSNGILHAVVTGVPRPFREPGIQAPDGVPAGSSIPPIPRWDFNPELFTVDTDGIGATALDLAAGARLTNLAGPLDYGFRRYTVMREPNAATAIVPGPTISAARVPTADEFTVASYNLERFFDTVNDPAINEPVLTPVAFQKRLGKASAAIRDYLNLPDILGVVEVENLSTLQALAARVNADAIAAERPDPGYVAHLVEGNDVGGIDVGFLVKTGPVGESTPRVEVFGVQQLGKDTTWIDPSTGAAATLNDRPPLLIDAIVHYADGRTFPITTVVVHQRSFNGVDSTDPTGATTEGNRVRRKRQAQAEFLANELQVRQAESPDRRIVVVGDFNAFEFNDGYADAMGTATGRPSPDDQTVVPGDGADLVNPDFSNLANLESPDQRYSFVFGGNAQSLDHVIANQALLSASTGTSLDHARINADFPEVSRNTDGPARLSDHDPAIAYFTAQPLLADLSMDAVATTPSVAFGNVARWDVRVTHDGKDPVAGTGGDDAAFPGVGFALDFAAPDAQVTAPGGWTCDAFTVTGDTTSAACTSTTAMTAGDTADFAVSAAAPASRAGGTLRLATSATSETRDPQTADNSDSATVSVGAGADLSIALSGPRALSRNTPIATYRATLENLGPVASSNAVVRIAIDTPQPSTLTIAPSGWSCRRLVSATFLAECTRASLPVGNAGFIDVRMPFLSWIRKSSLTIEATVAAANDPGLANNGVSVTVPASL